MNSENDQKESKEIENVTEEKPKVKKEIDEETKLKRQEALLRAIIKIEDRADELQSEKMERCILF
jgi:hypothetical protein